MSTMPAAWLTVNAPDFVMVYVARLVKERDKVAAALHAQTENTYLEENRLRQLVADLEQDNGIIQRELEEQQARVAKLGDALGAAEDITKNCPAACGMGVMAIRLGVDS